MREYSRLRNALSVCFSIETGLSDESAHSMFLRGVTYDPKLREEVESALIDPDVDWQEILCNSEYEVCDTESREDAREIARKLLRMTTT